MKINLTLFVEYMMPKVSLVIPLMVLMFVTTACQKEVKIIEKTGAGAAASNPLLGPGSLDGSGGNVIRSEVKDVKRALKGLKGKLKGAFHRIQYFIGDTYVYTMYPQDQTILSQIVTELGTRGETIFTYIDKIKINIKPDEDKIACQSNHGDSDMAMDENWSLCVSVYNLRKYPKESLELHIIALAAHELTHGLAFNKLISGVAGTDEEPAEELQKFFLKYPFVVVPNKQKANLLKQNLIQWLSDLNSDFRNSLYGVGLTYGTGDEGNKRILRVDVDNICAKSPKYTNAILLDTKPTLASSQVPLPLNLYYKIYGIDQRHQQLQKCRRGNNMVYDKGAEDLDRFVSKAREMRNLLNELNEALADVENYLKFRGVQRYDNHLMTPWSRAHGVPNMVAGDQLWNELKLENLYGPSSALEILNRDVLSQLEGVTCKVQIQTKQALKDIDLIFNRKSKVQTKEEGFGEFESMISQPIKFVDSLGVKRTLYLRVFSDDDERPQFARVLLYSSPKDNIADSRVVTKYSENPVQYDKLTDTSIGFSNSAWAVTGIMRKHSDSESQSAYVKIDEVGFEFRLLNLDATNTHQRLPEVHRLECRID